MPISPSASRPRSAPSGSFQDAAFEEAAGVEATLHDLVRARWALIACVGGLALLVAAWTPLTGLPKAAAGLPATYHVPAFVAVLAAWSLLNGWNGFVLRSIDPDGRTAAGSVAPGRGRAGLHLVADVAALTGLLAASGGASNPFTALYFVPLTLATQISPRWAWGVGGSAVVGFGLLLLLGSGASVAAGPHAHHTPDAQHFTGHLRGMWIALGVAGSLLTYFVHRIAVTRAAERAELGRLRREALEDRHLTALGTLAAGAAHELATPLGTVQVLAGELAHMGPDEQREAVTSMRAQIRRCKEILGRMASPELRVESLDALPSGGDDFSLDTLSGPLEGLGDASVRVEVSIATGGRLRQPRRATLQILTELVHNAVETSRTFGAELVQVESRAIDDGWICFDVVDRGGGLGGTENGVDSVDASRALEPFFTTRPEGRGMGLGLYLVRAHVRQLGGRLELNDRPGQGLTATVCLPGYAARSSSSAQGTVVKPSQ